MKPLSHPTRVVINVVSIAVTTTVLLVGTGCVTGESPRAASVPPPNGVPDIRYVLDDIQVSGAIKTKQSLILDLVGVPLGESVGLDELDAVRRRLLRTGFFSDVAVRLQKGASRGHVILEVTVEERNTILLNDVIAGSSTREPFWGGVDVVEGNLLGQGLTLGSAFVAGRDQRGFRMALADPYSFALPLRLSAAGHFLSASETIFATEGTEGPTRATGELASVRAGGELGAGLYPLSLLGVFVDLGFETVDADSTAPNRTESFVHRGRSSNGYVRLTLDHDTRDDPWVPTSGYRLNLSLQSAARGVASDYNYLKAVLRSSYHRRLPLTSLRHVLRFDLFGGIIVGEAPYYERFFVGDISALVPARDLTLNFSDRPSPDFLSRGANTLSYETAMAGGGVEYGVPIIEGAGPLYRVEFFMGTGIFGMTSPDDLPDLRAVRVGIDPGTSRARSSFPLDLTFDIGFRAETPIGIFGLSFANGLALVPL